jgi:CheY-like chemotaxis protein
MTEPLSQTPGPRSEDRKKRLLIVVDGDGAQLYHTSILLQRLEYNIFTTKTAEEALEIMNITVPALVLSDVVLPNMDGLALLKQIKQNAKLHEVPLIIHTASNDPALKEISLREGAAAFLKKSIDPDALYAAIQNATETAPRHYIRLKVCLQVIIGEESVTNSSLVGDCVTAISENGMYVSTPQPLQKGSQQSFTFFLQNMKIKALGSVLYSFDREQGPLRTPGMGIKFTQIRPEDQAIIRDFIKKQLTQDL